MAFVFIDPRRHTARKRRIKKSVESQRVLDALDAYLEGNYQEPMRWLVHFWRDQATVLTYKELRSIVIDEDEPEKLFDSWYQDYSKLLNEKMTSVWESAFRAGADSNPVLEGVVIDNSDVYVRDWIVNHTGNLITNVTEDQVNAVRYIVAESKAVRMGSDETARYIRPIVGLTERQAQANLKHYTTVKEKLQEEHPRMKPENIERKARESAAKYAQKQQMYRAETISRTEIAQAYNQGNDAIIKQAMEQGLISIQKKVWSTAMDGHVCEACEALEGVEIDMDKEFSATIGVRVRRTLTTALPPMHPRCKCAVMYESTGEYMTPASMAEPPSLTDGIYSPYMDSYRNQYDDSSDKHPEPLSRIYVNHEDKLYQNLMSVPPLEEYEDFGVHGVPNESKIEYETTNGVMTKYSASEYAQILLDDPEYHGGNIRLLSCGAGSDRSGFAQELADTLGVEILAPTETLWVAENGEMFISDSDILADMWYNNGEVDNSFQSTGYWKQFSPKAR